jgi:hypothetical protein
MKTLKEITIGDTVITDGDSSFCSRDEEKVINITVKYDENSGEPYNVIWVDGDRAFDSRTGDAINPPLAYYITTVN